MKQRTFLLAAALAAGTLLSSARAGAQAPTRVQIAVLDVQRILAMSEEGKREIAKIKKVESAKTDQLAQMEAEIKKLNEKLTDLGFSISEAERTKLQREIEDKMIVGERFRKDSLRQIKGNYEDVLVQFEKRIGPIVEKIGAERGIQLILHRDNPAIAWADKSIDITADIIDRFDKESAGQ